MHTHTNIPYAYSGYTKKVKNYEPNPFSNNKNNGIIEGKYQTPKSKTLINNLM